MICYSFCLPQWTTFCKIIIIVDETFSELIQFSSLLSNAKEIHNDTPSFRGCASVSELMTVYFHDQLDSITKSAKDNS